MYAQAGDWDKCLDLAEKQVRWCQRTEYNNQTNTHANITLCPPQGAVILSKYVALYAADLIKSNAVLSALQLFTKYGAPPNPQVHQQLPSGPTLV